MTRGHEARVWVAVCALVGLCASAMAAAGTSPAKVVGLLDAPWGPAGTLAFRFRLSRALRYDRTSKQRPTGTLAECPLFRLTLTEHRGHVILAASMKVEGKRSRALRAATEGRLFWSHLKGGPWYHLAFTWDAAKGRMDTYLNGAIQQEMRLRRRWQPWPAPKSPSGKLVVGGTLGQGETLARIEVSGVQVLPTFTDQDAAANMARAHASFPLTGEGLWDLPGSLDLSPYKLTRVHDEDFGKPLNWVHEDALFNGMKRVRLPEGKDWVLEGNGKAWRKDGKLVVRSNDTPAKPETSGGKRPFRNTQHLVLWNTRPFPRDFLLEFSMSPINPKIGLTIVFFSTRNLKGGSPFDLWLAKRGGNFSTYHSGELNGYHASYFATNPADGGILRRTTNLRKNCGFYMPCAGIDRIGGTGAGPHRVRLLKVGGKLRLETAGRMALSFDDDGKTYGPVWSHDGWIGLRQMGHTQQVTYTSFKVWKVEPK